MSEPDIPDRSMEAQLFFTQGWRRLGADAAKQRGDQMGPEGNVAIMPHKRTYKPLQGSLEARVKQGGVAVEGLLYKEMRLIDNVTNPFTRMLDGCVNRADYCVTETYVKPYANCVITAEAWQRAAAHYGLSVAPPATGIQRA